MIVIPESLRRLAEVFPVQLYIVGGYVRNSYIYNVDTDIDICGAISADKLQLPPEFKVIPVNERLGTVLIKTSGKDKIAYEYTPFRTEIYPEGGSHTPVAVSFTEDIYADSLRRDFTVNAIYYDIRNNKTIDFHNGLQDIQNKLIRAVDNPEHVFGSDGLRIMRLIRQSAEMGFEIEEKTYTTAKRLTGLLADISPERIRQEFDKILAADTKYNIPDAHYNGLKLIGSLGAWKYIIPEIEDMIGCEQNPVYHRYDVYEHSLQCARFVPPRVRLAALLHDIGKPESLRQIGKMYRHPELGAEIARRALGQRGLKYSNAEVSYVVRLIEGHMYNRDGKTRKNKLRRFVAAYRDILPDLIGLIKADAQAKGFDESENRQEPNYRQFLETLEDMKQNNIPFSVSGLEINGNDLIAMGKSGEEIGRILNKLFDDVLCSHIRNNRDILLREAAKC